MASDGWHGWTLTPTEPSSYRAAIVSVVSHEPHAPEHYKALLSDRPDLAHVTVEVHRCPGAPCAPAAG